jgi:hypothetical protein
MLIFLAAPTAIGSKMDDWEWEEGQAGVFPRTGRECSRKLAHSDGESEGSSRRYAVESRQRCVEEEPGRQKERCEGGY